jgi:NAD(P)-dependent dehydrogenase (short-subunit alcohol dehydrogenase family)
LSQRYSDQIRAVALDVTNAQAAADVMKIAVDTFGRLDVVVNNAGYANVNSVEDMAEDDFRAQIETNFFGVVNVSRAALPIMRAKRSGHIIQISSIGGRYASPGLSAYQSAKWAVGGFSEVLAQEVAPLGIKVTVLEPGGMRTDWAGSSMHIDELRSDYQPTVGAFSAAVRQHGGVSQSDPAKVARVILQIADEKQPPLRLLAGSDAVFLGAAVSAERAKQDAKWKALSLSTDVDGLPDFSETPIARMVVPEEK